MLTCVYHPIDGMAVVEDDEAEHLKLKGVWFDSPLKATQYKEKLEAEIKAEDAIKNDTKPKQKGNRK